MYLLGREDTQGIAVAWPNPSVLSVTSLCWRKVVVKDLRENRVTLTQWFMKGLWVIVSLANICLLLNFFGLKKVAWFYAKKMMIDFKRACYRRGQPAVNNCQMTSWSLQLKTTFPQGHLQTVLLFYMCLYPAQSLGKGWCMWGQGLSLLTCIIENGLHELSVSS